MIIKSKSVVVNRLTGEVGEVIATHIYQPEMIEVASVRFTNETRWVVASCLSLLNFEK